MSAVVHITSLYYYNYLFINERTFMVTIMLHVYWLEECTDCCHDAHIVGNYQHIQVTNCLPQLKQLSVEIMITYCTVHTSTL